MNKKVLVFAVALMAVAMLATPVMAKPAQKIPITVQTTGTSGPYETDVLRDDGVRIAKGAIRSGTVVLTIDGQDPLEGTYSEIVNFESIVKKGHLSAHFQDVVMTFETEDGVGSFKGVKIMYRTFIPFTYDVQTIEQHGVLQGSGVFEGCTLKLSLDWAVGDPLPRIYTGYLLISASAQYGS